MSAEQVVANDMEEITGKLDGKYQAFDGKTILLTGGAGFLGYYFIHFFLKLNDGLLKNNCKIICMDNFMRGVPDWLGNLKGRDSLELIEADIITLDVNSLPPIDYIIHAASIASPTFYRQFPIETMDANIIGLRNLLDYCVTKKRESEPVTSFLFFSSSEIYGDPVPEQIPTPEKYRGNVSCTGPRACYDESKRYGETLCVNFQQMHDVPVKMARPFNNYGPGLGINDRRVIPDFCRNIFDIENIIMLSDGSPTRTFCYVADAIYGYLLILLSDEQGEPFNIGIETPEISMKDLARKLVEYAETEVGISGLEVITKKSEDGAYLVDSPIRRSPSIKKARDVLGYVPTVSIDEGLKRTLRWYADHN